MPSIVGERLVEKNVLGNQIKVAAVDGTTVSLVVISPSHLDDNDATEAY